MIVFVVPLKSASASRNWHLTSKLFERCIRSICNQSSSDFKAIVVCHEIPDIAFQNSNIDYVQVDFPAPSLSDDLSTRRTDKSLKVWQGLNYAKKYHPSHAMIVDADDLLSCNIAKFVTQYPECYGWCIDKGYEYREGTKYIYYMKSKFYDKCGSCNIIRFDLLDKYINADVADITNSDIADIGGFNFLHHQSIPPLMIKNGTPLEKLPFEGAVYVIDHGENMWLGAITSNMLKQANFKDLFLFKLRRFVKKMLSQRLSDSIRQTFSLYTLS